MKQEDDPPSGKNSLNKLIQNQYERAFKYITVLWRWLFGDVFSHPKNVLDFQRPVVRSGCLSVF
jgi:hypothetical protein